MDGFSHKAGRLLAASALALVLSTGLQACGGGSGGDSVSVSPPPPPTPFFFNDFVITEIFIYAIVCIF